MSIFQPAPAHFSPIQVFEHRFSGRMAAIMTVLTTIGWNVNLATGTFDQVLTLPLVTISGALGFVLNNRGHLTAGKLLLIGSLALDTPVAPTACRPMASSLP